MSRLHASIPSWWKRHKLIFNRCIIVYFHIHSSKKVMHFIPWDRANMGSPNATLQYSLDDQQPGPSITPVRGRGRARGRGRGRGGVSYFLLLWSAAPTWSSITWYCIHHSSDWGRIYIRIWIHKTHPIPRPNVWAMGCVCEDSEYLIARVITTTRCIFN